MSKNGFIAIPEGDTDADAAIRGAHYILERDAAFKNTPATTPAEKEYADLRECAMNWGPLVAREHIRVAAMVPELVAMLKRIVPRLDRYAPMDATHDRGVLRDARALITRVNAGRGE